MRHVRALVTRYASLFSFFHMTQCALTHSYPHLGAQLSRRSLHVLCMPKDWPLHQGNAKVISTQTHTYPLQSPSTCMRTLQSQHVRTLLCTNICMLGQYLLHVWHVVVPVLQPIFNTLMPHFFSLFDLSRLLICIFISPNTHLNMHKHNNQIFKSNPRKTSTRIW